MTTRKSPQQKILAYLSTHPYTYIADTDRLKVGVETFKKTTKQMEAEGLLEEYGTTEKGMAKRYTLTKVGKAAVVDELTLKELLGFTGRVSLCDL